MKKDNDNKNINTNSNRNDDGVNGDNNGDERTNLKGNEYEGEMLQLGTVCKNHRLLLNNLHETLIRQVNKQVPQLSHDTIENDYLVDLYQISTQRGADKTTQTIGFAVSGMLAINDKSIQDVLVLSLQDTYNLQYVPTCQNIQKPNYTYIRHLAY